MVTTGPTAVRSTCCGTLACPMCMPAPVIGRAPLLRFSSPATLAGCARAIRGGRPPDDPASAFPSPRQPAHFSQCNLLTRCLSFALAVFRFERIHSDEARVADALGQGVPIESVARAALGAQWAQLRPCRRVDDLLLWHLRLRSHARVRSAKPIHGCDIHRPRLTGLRCGINVVTLACDPYHSSAFARIPPPGTGHSPNRAFFAWRSATHRGHCTAWPDDAGPSLSLFRRPTAFMGFFDPSQV